MTTVRLPLCVRPCYGRRYRVAAAATDGPCQAGRDVRRVREHTFVTCRCFVYKLKPTREQAASLERYLEVTRAVYNAALEQRITAHRDAGRSLRWYDQTREIKHLRAAGLTQGVHVHTLQDALRRLDRAYADFFRRCKRGARRKGFPRLKDARHWRSFTFQQWGCGVRLDERQSRMRITSVGWVRIRLHRALGGTPKTCTLVRKADGWYAHVVCEVRSEQSVWDDDPAQRASLDLGVEALATLHTGVRIENVRALDRARAKMRREERGLVRKRRGSRRRRKQANRLARAHLKVARIRRDHLHKESSKLAKRYRFIAVEDLTVTEMVRSAAGTVARPGRRVRQKAGLNREILDAAWAEFLELLSYKLAERGGQLIRVNPYGTSQLCSRCGARVPKDLSERWHRCSCGLLLHRDHNAAMNIYQRAWAVPVAEVA